MANAANPTRLTVSKDKDQLEVAFGPSEDFAFSAEFLRVLSPSAEVRGHSEADRKTVGGKRNVRISAISPIGNYAVKITFDDGHSTGIFSWDYFRESGENQQTLWSDYLAELEAKGLDRDIPQII